MTKRDTSTTEARRILVNYRGPHTASQIPDDRTDHHHQASHGRDVAPATVGPDPSPMPIAPQPRLTIIYSRYSTEMQDSFDAQERKVRQHLDHLGIDYSNALYLRDPAITGSDEYRPEYVRLKQLIRSNRVELIVVDDLSRLSRGSLVVAFIEDLQCHSNGRLITVAHGLDTARDDWRLNATFLQYVNSTYNITLAHQIRRTQEDLVAKGYVLSGSPPLGYTHEFVDPNWPELIKAGRRARKKVVIDERDADTVRDIFHMFAHERLSMCEIARRLNAERRPKSKRARSTTWQPGYISWILKQTIYAGQLEWGREKVKRDSNGLVKRMTAPRSERLIVDRPDLQIIDEVTWQHTQNALRSSHAQWMDYWKNRNVKTGLHWRHYRASKRNLAGLVYCAECSSKLELVTKKKGDRDYTFFVCSTHRYGKCSMSRQVQYKDVEHVVYDFFTKLVHDVPSWLKQVYDTVCSKVTSQNAIQPRRAVELEAEIADRQRQIDNLAKQIAKSKEEETPALMALYTDLEREQKAGKQEYDYLKVCTAGPKAMPSLEWVQEQLADLPALLSEARASHVMRDIFKSITVRQRRRVRGGTYVIRLNIVPSSLLAAGLGQEWQEKLNLWFSEVGPIAGENGVFTETTVGQLDDGNEVCESAQTTCTVETEVARATQSNIWGAKIHEFRKCGLNWNEIALLVGLPTASVRKAYETWQQELAAA